MKFKLLVIITLLLMSLVGLEAAEVVALQADQLRLAIDDKGFFADLRDQPSGESLLHRTRPSALLGVKRYGKPEVLTPIACRVIDVKDGVTRLRLAYHDGLELTVAVRPRQGWFRLELTEASNIQDVDSVIWGPLNTCCEGPVGEFFGLVRSDTSTLGLMSLEPNTDGSNKGEYASCAGWLPWREGGSYLALLAEDHTRPRPIWPMRSSTPVPGFTVLGSAVALYRSARGAELPLIGRIAQAEGLPYPKYEGEWSKTSRTLLRPSVWGNFGLKNFDQYAEVTKTLCGVGLCGFNEMHGNWGHFEPDLERYPQGLDDIRACIRRLGEYGLGLTLYTMTDFIRPRNRPEPFISPKPDPRLAAHDPETTLLGEITAGGNSIRIKPDPNVVKLLISLNKRNENESWIKSPEKSWIMLWMDDEFINVGSWRQEGDAIVLEACLRGSLMTIPAVHAAGTRARFVYFAGYKNVFPGTLDMCEEVARNIAVTAQTGGFYKVTFDGHESAAQATGHGFYAMNKTAQIVYQANRDILLTSSRITQYSWHMLSYISWGEFDMEKGFRGSMLDYRLRRQAELSRNHMPHKMGQHYPTNATLEDMLWLCGQAAGWDSGIELSLDATAFKRNPACQDILAAVARWEKARLSGRLSDEQKMLLRQVDCVYDIREKGDGGFEISLVRRWRHPGVEILPASTIQLQPTGGTCRVEAATVGIDALHSPLVASTAALSDDIVCESGKPGKVNVLYPGPDFGGLDQQKLQFVLHVPADAPAGIVNPQFITPGGTFVIPTEVLPGQYAALTLDMPIAHVYDTKHHLLRDVSIRHTNELPRVPRGKSFDLEILLPSRTANVTTAAHLNLYTFQPQ